MFTFYVTFSCLGVYLVVSINFVPLWNLWYLILFVDWVYFL